MIKALAETPQGHPLILLGLSEMNVQKLKEGLPMQIHLQELGLNDAKVIIFYGKTEDEMAKMFQENVKIDNVVDHRDEYDDSNPETH